MIVTKGVITEIGLEKKEITIQFFEDINILEVQSLLFDRKKIRVLIE